MQILKSGYTRICGAMQILKSGYTRIFKGSLRGGKRFYPDITGFDFSCPRPIRL
jgi:hypothetical protein